jgi:glutaredoxin
MKKLQFLFLLLGFVSTANAADITIFFSPSCPHCHHARDFIKNELIYEYDNLKVIEINATSLDNRQTFLDTLTKCKYKSGGVPVMVVGEKCFQGYADSIRDDIRKAVEIDLTDTQKQSAIKNRTELNKNRNNFISTHGDRLKSITTVEGNAKKK